jgi:D-alanyl-D-alanine carboxypeptidase
MMKPCEFGQRFLLFICLLAAAVGCRSPLTKLPPKETRTFQSLLEWSHQNGMPGAILLVKTPTTNFLASIGYADIKRKVRMQTNQLFRIGSVTKTFTGIVAAQLCAEGLLDCDKPITNYLPAPITGRIANSERITVRQLAQHTSGIPANNTSYWFHRLLLNKRENWPVSRELEFVLDRPAAFEPGQGWEYSNSNFLLLGLIIDQVVGHHHSVEIRRRLLDPLHLENTNYELFEPSRGELAHGYEKLFGFTCDTSDWTPVTGGNSGLVSTVSDLGTFIRAVTGTTHFPDDATRRLMRNKPNPKSFDRPWYPTYGYDFGVNSAYHSIVSKEESESLQNDPLLAPSSPVFFGHAGTVPGYLCFAWHEPRKDITIVFFGSSGQLDMFHFDRPMEFQGRLEKELFEMANQLNP